MKQDTVIKLFGEKTIRTHFDGQAEEWYFSVVDVVEALTDSLNPRDYWFKMKQRVKLEDGIELSTLCRQLKLTASDGKKYNTDCANFAICTTPTGLNIKAQGCAYSRYPGKTLNKKHNPNGVEHYFSINTPLVCLLQKFIPTMCNPVGVVFSFLRPPRVASHCSATLGFDMQPRWGCKIMCNETVAATPTQKTAP